jgi:protein CpxP
MIRKISTTLMVLGALLLAGPVSAETQADGKPGKSQEQRMKYGDKHGHRDGFHKQLRELDLSDEQREQVKAISQEIRPQFKEQGKALREVSKQIHTLTASDAYDAGQVAVLADQKGAIVAEMTKLKADRMSKVRAILTPEQQAKFAELHVRPKQKK